MAGVAFLDEHGPDVLLEERHLLRRQLFDPRALRRLGPGDTTQVQRHEQPSRQHDAHNRKTGEMLHRVLLMRSMGRHGKVSPGG